MYVMIISYRVGAACSRVDIENLTRRARVVLENYVVEVLVVPPE